MIQQLSGATPIADGNVARSFALALTENAVLGFENVRPGRTYNLQVEQAGGFQLTFAGGVRNPVGVSVVANTLTEMGFVCLDDGTLYLSRIGTTQP